MMNYVRTAAGGMMAITHKTNTVIAVKKQTATKPETKPKKYPIPESK